jgi:hypothetical protein
VEQREDELATVGPVDVDDVSGSLRLTLGPGYSTDEIQRIAS